MATAWRRILTHAIALATGMFVAVATAQVPAPQRKAGWWEMSAHLQSGAVITRYLCVDAGTDPGHAVVSAQDGCAMTIEKIAGGYSYKKVCAGQVTTGTAMGDFNSAYKLTERRGNAQVQTDARWLGACPAGHKAGDVVIKRP